MINPSAPGWIEKFFQAPENQPGPESLGAFYREVRQTGFIYGYVLSFYTSRSVNSSGWIDEEKSKLALLVVLHRLYLYFHPEADSKAFIRSVNSYYRSISPKGYGLLSRVLPGNSESSRLEGLISERVRTNDNIISKHFSHVVTNALLFLDVLGYQKFLETDELPAKYLKRAEELIISVVSVALRTKPGRSGYDELLIKLLDSSLRYGSFSQLSQRQPDFLPLDFFSSELERYYILDMAALALWSDGEVEATEKRFVFELADSLGLTQEIARETLKATNDFIQENRSRISYFRYSNPVKHFYDNMSESVALLINRNKRRLAKEISQSGELMKLLAVSAKRDLDEKEKKRVKKQLLDICKTIPSLTIFLLPGGSLLLPILIKFIPQMLPSAFNENIESE